MIIEEESGFVRCYFNKVDIRILDLSENDCERCILDISKFDKFINTCADLTFYASEESYTWLSYMSNKIVKPILVFIDNPRHHMSGNYAQLNVLGFCIFNNMFV